jgi:hypothetical protein
MKGRANMIAKTLIGAVIAFVGATSMSAVRVQAAKPRTAELQLHQVKAIDECGSGITEWGHDRMTLGAVTVRNGVVKTRQFALGKFGHDGSTRNYSRPKTFLTFDIQPGVKQRFQAVMVMAERDVSGGFGEYLKELAAHVQKGLPAPATGKEGDPVKVGEIAAVELAMLGLTPAAATAITGQVLAGLKDGLKDDILKSHLEEIAVRKDGTVKKAELTPRTHIFQGSSCKYAVTYAWAVK